MELLAKAVDGNTILPANTLMARWFFRFTWGNLDNGVGASISFKVQIAGTALLGSIHLTVGDL